MSRYTKILFIVVSALILCYLGFYNNFPLVNNDTGTYIKSGFTLKVPQDRPILYGLFIGSTSLHDSLYLVTFMQGFLLSLLIYYYFKYLLKEESTIIHFVIYVVIIAFFTGISYNVSEIMSDIFTSISMLCMGLLLLIRDLKTRDLITITFIALISIGTHNSHYMILAGILFVTTVIYLFRPFRKRMEFLTVRRLVYTWALLIVANLFVATIHFSLGSEFNASRGGHVYFMTRLVNLGVLQEYLDECCGEKDYKFCEYKDNIPMNFLWDQNSPLYKTGGWEENKEEYTAIILDIMTTPKYAKEFIFRGIEGAFRQFFNFEHEHPDQLRQGSSPHRIITRYFPEQERQYLDSRQNRNMMDVKFLNTTKFLLFVISLIAVIVLLLVRIPSYWKFFIGFFLLCLVMNASVCGIYYVSPRFQNRIIWMLTLPVFLILVQKDLRMSVSSALKS